MKNGTQEILRWIGVAAFGGFGVWTAISASYHILSSQQGGWLITILLLGFIALFTAPSFIVAYICLRRNYRELFNVLAVVGGVIVFGILITLPRHLHIQEYFVVDHVPRDDPWSGLWVMFLAVVGFPVSLLCLFGPAYAARWVNRWCRRMAQQR